MTQQLMVTNGCKVIIPGVIILPKQSLKSDMLVAEPFH